MKVVPGAASLASYLPIAIRSADRRPSTGAGQRDSGSTLPGEGGSDASRAGEGSPPSTAMQATRPVRSGSSPRSSAATSESGVGVPPAPTRSLGTDATVAVAPAGAGAGAVVASPWGPADRFGRVM